MAVSITIYKGRRFSPVCADAVKEWNRLATAAGIPFNITQGGFNGTNVSASAGTHAGDALDLSVRNLSKSQVTKLITLGRQVGFAAWFRTTKVAKWGTRAHGFSSYHIHAVPNGWGSPSSGARNQATSYRSGRDGLASNQEDLGPGHVSTYRTRTWTGYLTANNSTGNTTTTTPSNSNSKEGLTVSDINTIIARLEEIKAQNAAIANGTYSRDAINQRNSDIQKTVWVNTTVQRAGSPVSTVQELADTKSNTIQLIALVNGLTKALETSTGGKVNSTEIQNAAKKGAEDALKSHEASMRDLISGMESSLVAAIVEAQGDVDQELADSFAKAVLDGFYKRLEK